MLERAQAQTGFMPGIRSGWLYSLGGVLTAATLYSLLHVTARLIASGNLGEDDPLDAILTQTLSLGYQPGQPPLYDWALWLLERATGPGAVHFQLLKYGLLTATCGFIFLSARRVMKGEGFWAFLSVEALALIYQISWRFHEGFTHAVGAMCAVAATFWALLRLIEGRRLGDYALFGVCIGLGVLTVTTYWIFLAALLGAACLQPSIRGAVLDRRFAATLAIAALIAAPHFIWLAGTPDGIFAILPSFLADDWHGHLRLALAGIGRAFSEPVMYLAPLIFFYPLFFPKMLASIRRTARLTPDASATPDYEQLILHLTLLSVAALLAGALIFGIHRYPVHALMPLFLITSIWLTAQARRSAPSKAQMRRFVIVAASIAAFAFFARSANMYVLEPVCNICRWGVPYAELAGGMRQVGFTEGRIVVTDKELGGNLRRFFPDARIDLAGSRLYVPPLAVPGGAAAKTALVWAGDETHAAEQFQTLLPQLSPGDLATAAKIRVPWRDHFWKPDGYKSSIWHVLVLDLPGAASKSSAGVK
ncbi:glycosyltransferase family 39 protein [Rhodomicrobium sp. R_RK_3]|uniref:ArnT family glycosyltransferase n=1 Tax=Rhodomicrobium sp. R_RK_3 TaxID=2029567 RepID=UPI001595EEDF|nr:glycosyltransferase family 39 protein [Rhodomicrobium sp. R_RK_3]